MKCPKCKTPDLRATRLDQELPAAGCPACKGALVSLLYYRDWAERHRNDPASLPQEPAQVDAQDTSSALLCPKCGRLMTKYKISGCVANRLDVCPGCDESWLDGGEWELLKALELAHDLPAVFTDKWQKNIRRQVAEDARRGLLRKIIGDPALREVEDFKSWLDENEHKRDILVYLYADTQ